MSSSADWAAQRDCVLPMAAIERVRSDADPSTAARGLGATHLLTGTIERDRDHVRATVELLGTANIAPSGQARSTPMRRVSS